MREDHLNCFPSILRPSLRNEISTENKQFHYYKSLREKTVKENSEKLSQFLSQMKERQTERKKSGETGEAEPGASPLSRPPSMYDGLNMEEELQCPICFETARSPVYQCPEGHIICHSCRPRVTRCPVCRFVFKVSLAFTTNSNSPPSNY